MGTNTPNLALYKPAVGETGWGALVDTNWDTLDATIGVQTAHNPNALINGSMEIWQRGTTGSYPSSAYTPADRWRYNLTGAWTPTVTIAQSTNVPTVAQAGILFNNSLSVSPTAFASPGSGDYAAIEQIIEGNNWRSFAQRQFTVSFWVQSPHTGTFVVFARNSGNDKRSAVSYTIASANTWESHSVTFTASPATGTWDYGTGVGLRLQWMLGLGLNIKQPDASWADTGANITMPNMLDVNGNVFRLTGVKLELGAVATPLQSRLFHEELQLCQRYYQKSFAYATAPLTNVGAGTGELLGIAGKAGATAQLLTYRFAPPLLGNPSVSLYNPSAANSQVRDETASADCSAASATGLSNALSVTATGNAGTAVGNTLGVHWTADADLS